MTIRLRPSRKTTAGFTLLEALLSMALMGTILTALATITLQWLPNWNRGLGHIQRMEHAALGLQRIAADLAAAEFISPHRDTRLPLFDGAGRSVTFVRTSLGPHAAPGLEIVRIAEVNSAQGPILVRTRAPFTPAAASIVDRNRSIFTDPVVLLRSPYRLSFSFAGTNRLWRDSWLHQLQLPRAIKLTLRNDETNQALAISTATLIRVQLPVDCVTAKSFENCLTRLSRPAEPITVSDRASKR